MTSSRTLTIGATLATQYNPALPPAPPPAPALASAATTPLSLLDEILIWMKVMIITDIAIVPLVD
jgi:hypothetical protein